MEVFIPKWIIYIVVGWIITSIISSILGWIEFFQKRKLEKLEAEIERLETQFTCVACGKKNCSLIYSTDLGQKCGDCVPIGTN